MAPSVFFIRADQAERSFSPGGRAGRNPREQNSLLTSRARHALSPPCANKAQVKPCVFWRKCFPIFFLSVKNPPAMQETQVRSLAREDPLEGRMATHSNILAWKSHGQGRLAGYSPWGCKSRTWLGNQTTTTYTLFFTSLWNGYY